MRPSTVRQRLAQGRTVVNGWVASGSPFVAEVLSHAGYDCVTVDLQHGLFGPEALLPLLQAISCGPAEPWVRLPALDHAVIGKALDSGAYGLICPQVDTPEEAARFVASVNYPPLGRRSSGAARALLYGGADYAVHANELVQAWVLIESAEALEAVEEIAAVPGLTGLYIGPNDLALSLGLPGGAFDPGLQEPRTRILKAARAAGLYTGSFCNDAGMARRHLEEGFDLVTPMNDMGLLESAVAESFRAIS